MLGAPLMLFLSCCLGLLLYIRWTNDDSLAYTTNGILLPWHSRIDTDALLTVYLPVSLNLREPVQRFPRNGYFAYALANFSAQTRDGDTIYFNVLVDYRVWSSEIIKSPDMDYGLFLHDAVTSHLRTVVSRAATSYTRTPVLLQHQIDATNLPLVLDGLLNIVEIRIVS